MRAYVHSCSWKKALGERFYPALLLVAAAKNSEYGPGSHQSLYTLQPSTLVAGWIYKSATGTGATLVHRDICLSMYVAQNALSLAQIATCI